MKKIITLICFSLIVASGCTHEPQTEEPIKPLFTAYNIWKHDSASYMYCINFKSAPEFILVGTPVYDAKIAKKGGFRLIQFRIVATDEKISIRFRQRWHPGKSIEDYFNMMLTTKTFEQCIEGLNSEEIDAIKKGIIIKGMCKKAVIMSYGYPPEHKTPSLNKSQWRYWMSTVGSRAICFDEDDKA